VIVQTLNQSSPTLVPCSVVPPLVLVPMVWPPVPPESLVTELVPLVVLIVSKLISMVLLVVLQ